jgi:hypothetical protein
MPAETGGGAPSTTHLLRVSAQRGDTQGERLGATSHLAARHLRVLGVAGKKYRA